MHILLALGTILRPSCIRLAPTLFLLSTVPLATYGEWNWTRGHYADIGYGTIFLL